MEMKVLFIGNSYTYFNDMPKLFENLSRENGKDVQVFSVTCGGHKLCEYAGGDDEYTRQIDELMKTHWFDVCFLQEHSFMPITNYDLFIQGLMGLVNKLKPVVGKFILYETWGRKSGCPKLEELATTNKDMTFRLADAYYNASQVINTQVSYVGLNFYDVYSQKTEMELYNEDMTHPSYTGSCLAALTHYYAVFCSYPENTASISLTDTEKEILKNTVIKNLSV